jgi:hypothetical protein
MYLPTETRHVHCERKGGLGEDVPAGQFEEAGDVVRRTEMMRRQFSTLSAVD